MKMKILSLALLTVFFVALSPHAEAFARDALWKIVNTQCVPHQISKGLPLPCLYVDLEEGAAQGYAILKDLVGATQVLVIPTEKITGIEDPHLEQSTTPNYWEAAWKATNYVVDLAHKNLARDTLGLEVNSMEARTQDQLHIHVDCLSPEFKALLKQHETEIGSQWNSYQIAYQGDSYRVRKIQEEDLSKSEPFKLLAEDLGSEAPSKIGYHTLIVAGAIFADGSHGFYILDGHYYPGESNHGASGEGALDHACQLAK